MTRFNLFTIDLTNPLILDCIKARTMTTLKKHWLAIVLALAAILMFAVFVHRCSHAGAGGTPTRLPADPTVPVTTISWLASLDWQAIGMAVGALLTGIGAFYQLLLKFKAGGVNVDSLVSEGKTLFSDVTAVETAFKKPVASVPPSPTPTTLTTMPPANSDAFNAAMKMDKPVTMEKPANQ